ncbi:MAG: universal stress protein [Desulfobacteraceae bacterium]|nr:universal stress protein [Desulfobacteraceae bacterium]
MEQTCPLVKHENILVPLDGSTFGNRALAQAIRLANACASKLYLLTVVYQNPELLVLEPDLTPRPRCPPPC